MTGEREEEREKIMPSLMATSLRWRMHSARTNFFQMEDNHNNFLMEDDQKNSFQVDGGTSEP
jgi:hypothetical protein